MRILRISMLIVRIIPVLLCYKISKKNNYNTILWNVLGILFGNLALIALLMIILTKKNAGNRKKEIILLIVFLTITMSSYVYSISTHIPKISSSNMLNKGKFIKKNDLFVFAQYFHFFIDTNYKIYDMDNPPSCTKKQIDYILTTDQLKSNRRTALNVSMEISLFDWIFYNNKSDRAHDLYYIGDDMLFHMLRDYKHVKISQLAILKRGAENPYEHCKYYAYWVPAKYPIMPAESSYLKN